VGKNSKETSKSDEKIQGKNGHANQYKLELSQIIQRETGLNNILSWAWPEPLRRPWTKITAPVKQKKPSGVRGQNEISHCQQEEVRTSQKKPCGLDGRKDMGKKKKGKKKRDEKKDCGFLPQRGSSTRLGGRDQLEGELRRRKRHDMDQKGVETAPSKSGVGSSFNTRTAKRKRTEKTGLPGGVWMTKEHHFGTKGRKGDKNTEELAWKPVWEGVGDSQKNLPRSLLLGGKEPDVRVNLRLRSGVGEKTG